MELIILFLRKKLITYAWRFSWKRTWSARIIYIKSTILGHSRLSIIDPLNGTQPMQCLNNRFVITYNGEIFNYNELKDLLISHGIRFKTNCDTEVVLNAYIKFGVKCLDMFNGILILYIWQEKKDFFRKR